MCPVALCNGIARSHVDGQCGPSGGTERGRMVDGHAAIDLPPVGQRNVSLGNALP